VNLSPLTPAQRTDGAGLYDLSSNIESDSGISLLNALLARNFAQHVSAENGALERATAMQFRNPLTVAGPAALDASAETEKRAIEVNRPADVDRLQLHLQRLGGGRTQPSSGRKPHVSQRETNRDLCGQFQAI
jgi:hypothetical protein